MYDKRKIRKSLSPVVAPKKIPTVRFSDNEEDLLIKTSPRKLDPSLKKTSIVGLERPSFKRKIADGSALSPTTKQPFFANRLSERISVKKVEIKGDTLEPKEKEHNQVIFTFGGGQVKTQNRISSIEPKPKLDLEWAKKEREQDEKSAINNAPINILFRLTSILKVINFLRMRTFYRPLKYINDDQIELINDPSCQMITKKEKDIFLKQYTEKNFFKRHYYQFLSYLMYNVVFKTFLTNITKFIEKVAHYIPLIRPNQKRKLMFDSVVLFIILTYFFIIPMQLSFDFYYDVEFETFSENQGWSHSLTKAILVLPEAILILDSSLKMITGYYENGLIVMDRKKILLKYLLKNLIFDILSYCPILIQGFYKEVIFSLSSKYGVVLKAMQLLVFCKMKRIHTMIQNLEQIILLNGEHDYILSLFKVCWKIIFAAHVNACVWHAVAYYNDINDYTWLDYANLRGTGWVLKYWNSLYWATSAMVTIGYGEKVSPQNFVELFTGVVILLISSFMFGFTLNSMKQIFDQMSKTETEFKENISVINDLMKKEKIDFELQGRVRKYLEYIMDSDRNSEKQTQLLNKLTANLKREVLVQSNSKFLNAIPLFTKNFSTTTIEDLSLFMKKLRFSPEEAIYNAKDKDDCSLFILTNGEVEHVFIGANGEKQNLSRSMPGEVFGLKSFFTEEPREASAISKNISMVYEIKKRDFLSVLKKNSSDYEKFCQIKDEIKLYHNFESSNTRCSSCHKCTHLVGMCPLIHYIPDRRFLASRFDHSENQPGDRHYSRSTKRLKFNALAGIDSIDEALDRFWDENDEDLEESTVFGDYPDQERPSIDVEANAPLEILQEANENKESEDDSKVPLPNMMRNSNFLITKASPLERKSSISFEFRSSSKLVEDIGLNANNPNFMNNANTGGAEEREKNPNRSSQRLRKSRGTMLASVKLPSLKEKVSLKDMNSSKFMTKPPSEQQKESLFLMDLEVMNNFKHYFIKNNADNVIAQLKTFIHRKLSEGSSSPSRRRKRNYGRRNTRNKTVVLNKETMITNFEKNSSLQEMEDNIKN